MKVGIFLIHGFMEDAELTFKELKHSLNKFGLTDYLAVSLQGHGNTENINRFNCAKCLKKVCEQYQQFKLKYDLVYLIGVSAGGTISTYLAKQYGADKLVLVSPMFEYDGTSIWYQDNMNYRKKNSRFKIFNSKNDYKLENTSRFVEIGKKSYGLPENRNFLEVKEKVYLNFAKLIKHINKKVDKIDTPTRIYHADSDEMVPLDSSLSILKKIKSKDKKMIVISGEYHRILSSEINQKVFNEIGQFFNL